MKTEIKVDGNGRNTALLLATAVATVLVTTSASAESKTTHFTGEEIAVSQVQGDLFFNSPELYILNRELTAREEISDPRLKGNGYFKYTVIANMATGQAEFWGHCTHRARSRWR